MTPRPSVLVSPRDRVPYQELLYREVESAGVRVRYAEGPTPSQTLNLILAPVVLAWWRARGFRILHIHWVFQFSLPWARRARWARGLMELWFAVYLWSAQMLGFKIIWTAHDLLPHEPVFADDRRARERLLSMSKMVIALSEATASELNALGARHVTVIPHGPFANSYPVRGTSEEARASFGFGDDDVVASLIGRLETYKGADMLLRAAAKLPTTSKIKILVAGSCADESLRDELVRLAAKADARVTLVLEWVPVDDLARYLQAADFAIFPFRRISNSGSVILAQSFGLPVVIADLSSLSDIPRDAAIRFELDDDALVDALLRAETLSITEYRAMSDAALDWSTTTSWVDIGRATVETYEEVLAKH